VASAVVSANAVESASRHSAERASTNGARTSTDLGLSDQ
jgi:hypothetical protein